MGTATTTSPGLYGRRSFHIHGLDPFTIKAIKYLARARGVTHAAIIEWLIDDDLINQHPDLARARDQEQFRRGMVAEQHDIEIGPFLGGKWIAEIEAALKRLQANIEHIVSEYREAENLQPCEWGSSGTAADRLDGIVSELESLISDLHDGQK